MIEAVLVCVIYLQFLFNMLSTLQLYTTQNDFIYGELRRVNLQTHRYYSIIKYWAKLLTTDISKYSKKIYLLLKNDCENNIRVKNWCSLLKQLLCTLGFYEVWLFQEVGNVSVFLSNVKQRLSDQFIQGWDGRLNISSRASLYKYISSFKFKPYLDMCTTPKLDIF